MWGRSKPTLSLIGGYNIATPGKCSELLWHSKAEIYTDKIFKTENAVSCVWIQTEIININKLILFMKIINKTK